WIESEQLANGDARVSGDAWVSGNAQVYGNARVSGNAQVYGNARVSGNARVYGNARVSGNAWVYGNARVSGNARVYGNAWVSGNAQVYGNARVSGDARVYGNARVSGNAQVERRNHFLIVGPIGSENVTATLYRTKNGKHELVVGCWTGTLGTLSAEVKRRRQDWRADEATQERWVLQYKALRALGKATVSGWES
ncbi:polymer-forming cytoskeletal protein, partial [Plantibacter sp. YIM 135249]|uniref:polymer-forming cytoskeletal protein n=1 Tax=Plantibacter sp. YIM 135249 TaxID=3423918 RepID=UPI003D349ED5